MNRNKPQATLPLDMTKDTIAGMSPGTSAWTVPWAMSVDADMKCWLIASYTVHEAPGGTVEMLVTRESDGSYSVMTPRSRKYSPGPSHYVGDPDMLPVSQLSVVTDPRCYW